MRRLRRAMSVHHYTDKLKTSRAVARAESNMSRCWTLPFCICLWPICCRQAVGTSLTLLYSLSTAYPTPKHKVLLSLSSPLKRCLQVRAVDLDVGANGNITYSLVKSTDQGIERFQIDAVSGVIRTADVFDREAKIGVTDFGVTVKAEDHGSPTLAGFCTFRVKIGDQNDNPPVFNHHEYSASIEESSPINRRVKQVSILF